MSRKILTLIIFSSLLFGCAAPPSPLEEMKISRIGVISLLPEQATDLYMGLTIFENKSNMIDVSWNLTDSIINEFQRQSQAVGASVVDLNDDPQVIAWEGNWFTVGYSLKFGLTPHKITTSASTLGNLVTQNNLDAIILLRTTQFNSDIQYPNAHPVGTFGVFKRGGISVQDRQSTFLQFQARVLAGNPIAVTEDLVGSNLSAIKNIDGETDITSKEFEQQIQEQIQSAVREILTNMNVVN